MVMCLLNQFRFLSKGSVRATGYEINLLLTILNHDYVKKKFSSYGQSVFLSLGPVSPKPQELFGPPK